MKRKAKVTIIPEVVYSAEVIEREYKETSLRASRLQSRYLSVQNSSTWQEYVEYDEKIAQPWRVRMGQLSMQRQIDAN